MTATTLEITMPSLSDSMEEGTILKWLLASGESVAAGQELVEIETDKANMTHAAEGSGVLEILIEEGETVAVGTPIARLGEGPAAPKESEPPEPRPASTAPPAPVEPAPHAPGVGRPEIKATPLARRLARAHGIDLVTIGAGSGPRGRIVKADVLAAAGIAPASDQVPAPASTPSLPTQARADGARGGAATVEPTRLQAVIARRMSEAKATVPHFQVEAEAKMDAVLRLRATLKREAGEEPAPSVNDVIVKAAALALRAHPKANGSYRNASFELHDRVNVGIAVATAGALVVPTIGDADTLSLAEIGRESRRLATRVRAGEVTPPELAGGTFTVSNLGMFGMTAITPVINLPQAAILGVGAIREGLQRGSDGEIVDVSLMTLTLSCDHRILYGAEASEFLATIKRLLEEPLLML